MKRLILALTFGAFAAGSASAQLRLTLDDAIQMALSENPTIKVADLDVERYDYVKKETRGNLLPSLSASGEYTRAIEKSTMRGGISFGADNTFTGTASLSVPLFAPAVYRTLKLNRTQIASAVEAARSSRITLVAEVKKAFYNILLAEQSLATLEESRATIQRTVDDTKVKFEQGVASEYDYLTAQVELSNLLPTITQTKNSIRVAMLQLKMYLSVPEALSIELVGNLDEMKDVVLAGGETLSTDVSRNSDLRALDIQAEMLRYQLKTTNAARIPTVAAFGSATITGNDMEDFRKMVSGGAEAGTGEAVADLNSSKYFWTHPISVGVQISIPIFSGLKNSYKSRQVKNQIEQLDLQRDYAQRQTTVAVESAINNLLTAREMMLAQARTMAQADKAYHISDTRFRAGAGTILELNSAQLNRTQAHLRWVLSIPFFISCIRQQNPLTVLSKIILRKVKQFNLPPPKKMRDFCIFEDTPRLFLLGNRQFTFIAHNLDVAEDVVGQICHRHIRLRPYNPYCPDNKAVHTLLFKTEYVLDKATGLGLAPVLSLLFFCQRMIPTAFLADYRIHAMLLHG